MATTITNQATLTYNFGTQTATAESNIATAILQGPITAEKSSLDTDYTEGEDITYFVNLTNSSESALTNVTVTDDLGTYTVSPTLSVTPLTYTGPAQLFINGIPTTVLVPTVTASSVTFTIPSLSSGDNALIAYKATVNGNAPLATASTVENTVSVTADGIVETVTDSHILTVENYADVEIVKAMSPSTVTDGSTLTYSFEIFNYGSYRTGYNEDMSQCYQELLVAGLPVCPVAADDAHTVPDIGGGWVMIGAEALTYDAVIAALEKGDLYASSGPEIHSLTVEGNLVTLTCSGAANINMVTHGRMAKRVFAATVSAHFTIHDFHLADGLFYCNTDQKKSKGLTFTFLVRTF